MNSYSIAVLSRGIGVLCSYFDISFQQKCELLNINSHNQKVIAKRIKRFDDIMHHLENRKSSEQLSKLIQLKEKHTKKRLERLENIGLVKKRT